jgi:hypothetical protein
MAFETFFGILLHASKPRKLTRVYLQIQISAVELCGDVHEMLDEYFSTRSLLLFIFHSPKSCESKDLSKSISFSKHP